MRKHAITALALASACGVLATAGPASASTDVFIKLGDIKGESAEGTAGKDHKEWIEVQSFTWGAGTSRGDHTGDDPFSFGADAPTSSDSGPGAELSGGSGKIPAVRPGSRGPVGGLTARGSDPDRIALLLPAVQTVREAVVKRDGRACAAGRALGIVEMREEPSGATGRILDARISACSAGQISFNFSKIVWD
jgi:hypothetical protein